MILLALETSAPIGSVALGLVTPGEGSEISARTFLEDRGAHAASIVPAIDEVLEGAGHDRGEIEGIVVGSGPGSFTGVRVAAATAKGLAHALECPLFTVSSLEAAAVGDVVLPWRHGPWPPSPGLETPAPAEVAGAPRYVLFDARATRVYAACYRAAARLETLVEPAATTLEDVLDGPVPEGAFFVGHGALRHRDRIGKSGYRVLPPPAGMPTAAGILHVMGMEGERPPLAEPARWEPDYLRAPGAER